MARRTIFISYRRDDSEGYAGRLYDRLADRFGKDHVYRDVDTVKVGEDFLDSVRATVEECDTLLALIGPKWLSAADHEGRWRLANEDDVVRLEITTALEHGVRVVPVLLQGTSMPRSADLPGALAKLAQRQAAEIRDAHFERDLEQLLATLRPTRREQLARALGRPAVSVSLVAFLTVMLVAGWYVSQITRTREQARIKLGQMGLEYDEVTFVERAASGDEPAVSLFLEAGMDPNAEDADGSTALMRAARKGDLPTANVLLAAGAAIDRALPQAAEGDHREMLELLMRRHPTRADTVEALHAASRSGHTTSVQTLLDAGLDVDAKDDESGWTALMVAAASDLDTVRLLLARGADARMSDSHHRTALHVAARSGHDDQLAVLRALLESGAEVDARARWFWGFEGALIDTWTPLLVALVESRPEAAIFLLERGADPDARSSWVDGCDRTALMWVVDKAEGAVVPVLLAKGADPNARNNCGRTALMMAAEHDANAEIIRALLAGGADVGAADNDGWTSLMMAARIGDTGNVRELVAAGADLRARNRDGQSARLIAEAAGHRDLVPIFAPSHARRPAP
jgi:ankyrin repeat protein